MKSTSNPFIVVFLQFGWFFVYSIVFYTLMGALMFQPIFFLLYLASAVLMDIFIFIPMQVKVLGATHPSYSI